MRIAITGASGLVGRFLVQGLRDHDLSALGRSTVPGTTHVAWALGETPDLSGFDALIHCAFSHLPGRYRGGEGDDPQGFLRANLDGTRRLFDAAARDNVSRVVFLSSRAVFDGCAAGTSLREDLPPTPHSLYGKAKAEAEAHLATLPLTAISLRATGIHGASPMPGGPAHKWRSLFRDYLSGHPIAPRRGTEVHGADLAQAVRLLLDCTPSQARGPSHVSDLLLDTHDLLAAVQDLTGCPHALPPRSSRKVDALICARLPALGWRPGGWQRLEHDLPALVAQAR